MTQSASTPRLRATLAGYVALLAATAVLTVLTWIVIFAAR